MEDRHYRQLYELEDDYWWFRGRRAVIWALLRRAGVTAGARILDAGCGTGRNLQELGDLGPAQGVDASPEAVEFCHQRGLDQVCQAELGALPFDDASFDLVLACDVLEHIDDDEGALRELRRVAAPAARLLVTVPAYGWLWSEHDVTHHHQRRYTRARVSGRARANGWQPLLATYFNSVLLAPIAAVRGARRLAGRNGDQNSGSDYELTPTLLNGALGMPMRGEAALIARGVNLPAGVSVGLVCSPD